MSIPGTATPPPRIRLALLDHHWRAFQQPYFQNSHLPCIQTKKDRNGYLNPSTKHRKLLTQPIRTLHQKTQHNFECPPNESGARGGTAPARAKERLIPLGYLGKPREDIPQLWALARDCSAVRVSAAAAAQIVLQPVVWPPTGGHAQLVAGAIETGQAAGEGVLGLARANRPRRHVATRRGAPAKRIASMDVSLDMLPW